MKNWRCSQMMQVKLIRAKQDVIEDHINQFLLQLGQTPGMITDIKNVQLIHVGGPGQEETFMIMYNQYAAPAPPAVDLEHPKRPTGPLGPNKLNRPMPPSTKP